MTQKVTAVVGAQFGSEGKGAVVNVIANDYGAHVRTGGPQAGHTIVHQGVEFKMRCIPCGWVNPDAHLFIGPGGVVNPRQLQREIKAINEAGHSIEGRLHIDVAATPLLKSHESNEGHTSGALHDRIGSTGEGVGAARAAWMARDQTKIKCFRDVVCEDYPDLVQYLHDNVPRKLSLEYDAGTSILFEGTQGFGLSLHHGLWPYVTSHDTTPAQLLADAGFPAQYLTDVILVARTYPIRVAGNSGPLKDEMTWTEFCDRSGEEVPQEYTTVTKLPRRIGAWDHDIMVAACEVCAPTEVVLTFADYLSPGDKNVSKYDKLSDVTKKFVLYMESCFGPVTRIGTGYSPDTGWVCCKKDRK